MPKTLKKIIVILLIIIAAGALVYGCSAIAFEIVISQPSGETAEYSEWNLILVNNYYHIPSDYKVSLTELSNGQKVDERIYPDLQKMFDDMCADGVYPFVREGFRTADEQKAILKEFISGNLDAGCNIFEAYGLTRKAAAAVGNSEHQLGIAVDINADINKCEAWDVYNWLGANAYKYGFILRYPSDKTEITETIYEPWHYRYVGKEAAKEIYEEKLCLEEYISRKGGT